MSRNSIELNFADGEYLFALPLPQIEELQRKTETGIGQLHARVIEGAVKGDNGIALLPNFAKFYVKDLVETIRLGLIGGGQGIVNGEEVKVSPHEANRLVEAYVVTRDGRLHCPLYDLWVMAYAILGVCVCGFDPPKKAAPAEERAKKPRTKKAGSTMTERSPTAR